MRIQIRQWIFDNYPLHAQRIIECIYKQHWNAEPYLNDYSRNAGYYTTSGFIWENTIEGREYWMRLFGEWTEPVKEEKWIECLLTEEEYQVIKNIRDGKT